MDRRSVHNGFIFACFDREVGWTGSWLVGTVDLVIRWVGGGDR